MIRDGRIVRITSPDDPRLARFHGGIYWDAFAAQHEPLQAWRAALAGAAPYRLTIDLVVDDADEIAAGITYELYPRGRCGLVTYMVVAPSARRSGVGRELLSSAVASLHADGARAVFGEVDDPRERGNWERLERFQRWGARVVDARYVQPALGEGLTRDRGLLLIVFPPSTTSLSTLPGEVVRDFVTELYAVTEGGALDDAISIPEVCALVELVR